MLKKKRLFLQSISCQILLFKIGPFFKIYNEGVFLLKEKKYRINLEYDLVLSNTLTGNIFEELKNEYIIEEKDGYYILHFANNVSVSDSSAYLDWRIKQLENLMQLMNKLK